MNNFSKLMLSAEEQQLVNSGDWILTKRIIMDKVHHLLGEMAVLQKAFIGNERSWLPRAVLKSDAKISKGENYLQLPFMILDYPRCFDASDIFAVRTMFWWGNFFSITIHLSGTYKQLYYKNLTSQINKLQQNGFYICIHENQWHHHFEEDNYRAVEQLSAIQAEEIIRKKDFIKLAVKFPLQPWNNIPALLEKYFKEIIDLLKYQLPSR